MHPSLGGSIRAAREALDLNQVDVAEALSVSQSLVSRWEKNKAHPGDHLVPLASLLKVDLVELVERQFGICTDTELAILRDKQLSRRDQDALLAAYGVLTERNSLSNASLLRTRVTQGDKTDAPAT